MKHLGKILIIVILILLIIVLEKTTGIFGVGGEKSTIRIERTTMDFGREILGDKISIRDNIKVSQKGDFTIDGNMLGLGNERKSIEIHFLTELGYFMKDIIKSEKIDSFEQDQLLGRSLAVWLPLPDTLSFVEMRQDEKSNEWFWEGWYKDEKNIEVREKFLNELRANAYHKFRDQNVNSDNTSSFILAAMSVLNYVNNGYQLGNEQGFNSITATFINQFGNNDELLVVTCDEQGNCRQDIQVKKKMLD